MNRKAHIPAGRLRAHARLQTRVDSEALCFEVSRISCCQLPECGRMLRFWFDLANTDLFWSPRALILFPTAWYYEVVSFHGFWYSLRRSSRWIKVSSGRTLRLHVTDGEDKSTSWITQTCDHQALFCNFAIANRPSKLIVLLRLLKLLASSKPISSIARSLSASYPSQMHVWVASLYIAPINCTCSNRSSLFRWLMHSASTQRVTIWLSRSKY